MSKPLKTVCMIMCGIMAYTVVAELTARLNEELFPGDPTGFGGERGASDLAGAAWPIGLPITIGLKLADVLP